MALQRVQPDGHSWPHGCKKNTNMEWREQQKQGALKLGYTAARGGGDGGSWAAVGARAGNGAAGSSGGGSGGASCAASPAIAAVGTQQQLDRMEAAIGRSAFRGLGDMRAVPLPAGLVLPDEAAAAGGPQRAAGGPGLPGRGRSRLRTPPRRPPSKPAQAPRTPRTRPSLAPNLEPTLRSQVRVPVASGLSKADSSRWTPRTRPTQAVGPRGLGQLKPLDPGEMEVSELLSKLDADEVELHGDMEVSELLAKLEADRADLQAAASSEPKAQEAPTDEAGFLELLREFRDKKEEDYDTDVQ